MSSPGHRCELDILTNEARPEQPAIVALPAAGCKGHEIRDWETDEAVGTLSSSRTSMNLLPSSCTIGFGRKAVPLTLEPGRRTTVESVSATFTGTPVNARKMRDEGGAEVMEASATGACATLTAGKYVLDLVGRTIPFAVEAGMSLQISTK